MTMYFMPASWASWTHSSAASAARTRPRRRDCTVELIGPPVTLGSLARQGPDGSHGDAAVDEQRLAGHVAALLRRQEHHGAVEVVRLAGAARGDALLQHR